MAHKKPGAIRVSCHREINVASFSHSNLSWAYCYTISCSVPTGKSNEVSDGTKVSGGKFAQDEASSKT